MNRTRTIFLATLFLIIGNIALAQQATEVYIPIGESPGVSERDSFIGSISSVDHERYRMMISVAGETKMVTMTPATRYYLDKTRARKQNKTTRFEDCEVGQRIEAYVDDDGNAVWVKIEAPD